MSDRFEHVGERMGGHRLVVRPLNHSEAPDECEYGHDAPYSDLDNYDRLECIDCGRVAQGHAQALDSGFREHPCMAPPTGEKYPGLSEEDVREFVEEHPRLVLQGGDVYITNPDTDSGLTIRSGKTAVVRCPSCDRPAWYQYGRTECCGEVDVQEEVN